MGGSNIRRMILGVLWGCPFLYHTHLYAQAENQRQSPDLSQEAADKRGNIYRMKTGMDGAYLSFTVTCRDKAGTSRWEKKLSGLGHTSGKAIEADTAGNVYIIGDMTGTTDFDPGPGVQYHTANGGADVFILKLNSKGDFVWLKQIGGNGYAFADVMEMDEHGLIRIKGIFSNVVFYGISRLSLRAHGSWEQFNLKMNAAGEALSFEQKPVIDIPQDPFREFVLSGSLPEQEQSWINVR